MLLMSLQFISRARLLGLALVRAVHVDRLDGAAGGRAGSHRTVEIGAEVGLVAVLVYTITGISIPPGRARDSCHRSRFGGIGSRLALVITVRIIGCDRRTEASA